MAGGRSLLLKGSYWSVEATGGTDFGLFVYLFLKKQSACLWIGVFCVRKGNEKLVSKSVV